MNPKLDLAVPILKLDIENGAELAKIGPDVALGPFIGDKITQIILQLDGHSLRMPHSTKDHFIVVDDGKALSLALLRFITIDGYGLSLTVASYQPRNRLFREKFGNNGVAVMKEFLKKENELRQS